MKLKFYGYKNCGTCRKAISFLKKKEIEFEEIPIRDHPPSRKELKVMLDFQLGEIKKLFNTSGMDYRKLGIKDKIAKMSHTEAISMLNGNGNLIKRPFFLTKHFGLIGFKEALWNEKMKDMIQKSE